MNDTTCPADRDLLLRLRASITELRDELYSAERDLVTIPYGRIADRLDAILRAAS